MAIIASLDEWNIPVSPDLFEALAWSQGDNAAPAVPVVTVSLMTKWYGLYLVEPTGNVRGLNFGVLDEVSTWVRRDATVVSSPPYFDHVPNPYALEVLTAKKGWVVDELALDLIHGRWQREVIDVQAVFTQSETP